MQSGQPCCAARSSSPADAIPRCIYSSLLLAVLSQIAIAFNELYDVRISGSRYDRASRFVESAGSALGLTLVALVLALPLAWLIGVTVMRRIELVAAVVLVLIVELLNTAIEKLADRLTTEHDTQIGRVKDMGSAAVGVSLLMALLFWGFAIAERMGVV